MKKLVYYINLPLLLGAVSFPTYALEAMNDGELSLTTGEGLGAIVDNLSIHSAARRDDPNTPLGAGEFEITLDLSENPGEDQFIFSELRIHKTGTVSGSSDSGGFFGTVNDPVYFGDMTSVDIYTGDITDDNDSTVTSTSVLRAEFPGTELTQLDRSTNKQESNMAAYQADVDNFNSSLDSVSNKFNLHLRFDDVIDYTSQNFRATVDIEGFRFYGTRTDIFATAGHGISFASSLGLYIDQLTVSTSEATPASIQAASNNNDYVTTPVESRLIFNGIDIYTTLGTYDQPLTIDNVLDENGNNQFQIEIGGLPASIGVAPSSDVYVKSIYFGEQYNSDLRTGLREGATVGSTNPEDYYYAFQPDVGNTIEIRGIQVQHLKITTMDL